MGKYRSMCEALEHEPALQVLVDNLSGVLGADAGYREAARDFLEYSENVRDYKEVLEKLRQEIPEISPYAEVLEGSVEGNRQQELLDKIIKDIKGNATSFQEKGSRVTIPYNKEGKIKTKEAAVKVAHEKVAELKKKYAEISTNLFMVDETVDAGAAIVINISSKAVENYIREQFPETNEASFYRSEQEELFLDNSEENRAREILTKLAGQLGVEAEETTAEASKERLEKTGAPYNGEPAYFFGGKVYYVPERLTTKIALHEFSHPLLRSLSVDNPTLFDKLFTDLLATNEGASVAETVRTYYPELEEGSDRFKEEVLVHALTTAAKNKLEDVSQLTVFAKVINNIIVAFRQLLRKIFKTDVSKLGLDTTLDNLAEMLTKGEHFVINTEAVGADDVAAFIKDQQKQVEQLVNKENVADIQKLTNEYFTAIQRGITQAKNAKNYDKMLDFIANEFKSGELDKMRKSIEKYQTDILQKTSAKLGEVSYVQEQVNAVIDSLSYLHNLTGKISGELQVLTKDMDSQDNLQRIDYYKNTLNYWEGFMENIAENLSPKIGHDSSLAHLINQINGHIKNANNTLNNSYGKLAEEVLWKQGESTAREMTATFDARIKDLKSRLAKETTQRGKDTIEKEIKLETELFQEEVPTREKVRLALKGELKDKKGQIKDAPWLTSFIEGYAYNPDPVVGGLANYLKDHHTEMLTKAYQQANEFGNALKPLLTALGADYKSITGEGKFWEKIGQIEEVGDVDDAGNFIKKKVWRLANQFTGADVAKQEALHNMRAASAKYKETNSDEDRKELERLQGEYERLLRDFWHDVYTSEYYAVQDLLGKDAVGMLAQTEIEKIRNEIDLLDAPSNDIDEFEKLDRIDELYRQLRRLGDFRDDSGRLKTGDAMIIAERIKAYREKNRELHDFVEVPDAFNNALRKYEQQLIDAGAAAGSDKFIEYRKKWLERNLREVVKPDFYEQLKKIYDEIEGIQAHIPNNMLAKMNIKKLEEERTLLLRGHRDQDGHPIGSEMTAEKIAKVKELTEQIEKARGELLQASGLSKAEGQELNDVFEALMMGEETPQQRARMQQLMDRKNSLGLDDFSKKRLFALYAQLTEMQKKMPTDYYVDIMNSWLSTMDMERLKGQVSAPYMTKETAFMFLKPAVLAELFEQSKEFETWFKANHIPKEIVNRETLETEEGWERVAVWNVTRPIDEKHYETTTITNSDGTKEVVRGIPAMKYFKNIVKDQYRTKRIVGKTVDNKGHWLPKTVSDGAKDDRYENKAYYAMQKENPKLFALLEKAKEYHLKHQEGLGNSAKLYLDFPRFRKQSLERLRSKNLLQRLIQRIKDFWTRVKDGYDTGAFNASDDMKMAEWDMFDNELTGIPIAGKSNLDFEEVSTDLGYTMMRYMEAAERNKMLTELSPTVRAIQRAVSNPSVLAKKMLMNRTVFGMKGKRDRYIREQAVNNYIEREFAGIVNKGPGADSPLAQNVSTFLFKSASFTYLTLNIPSAVKNTVGMKFQGMIMSVGGKHFTPAEFTKAEAIAAQTAFQMSAEVYKEGSKSMYVQLADIFDFEQGHTEQHLGEGFHRSVIKDSAKVVARMGDFRRWTQLQAALQAGFAMLDHQKVEQNGKLISYKDAWEIKDGKLQLKEGIDKKWGITYDKEGKQHIGEEFKTKKKQYQMVMSQMNGAMSKAESPDAERYLLFRYLSFFRRFFTAMFADRFATNRVNYQLGDTVEGRYITGLKLIRKLATSLGGYLPMMTAKEKQAIIKNTVELCALWLIGSLLPGLMGWDPDDKERYEKLRRRSGALPLPGIVEDPEHPFNLGGFVYNHTLLLLLQAKAENASFIPAPGLGLKTYQEFLGLKSLAMGPTLNAYMKISEDAIYMATGNDKEYYKRKGGPYMWSEQGDPKILTHLAKAIGFTGTTASTETAFKGYEMSQNVGR